MPGLGYLIFLLAAASLAAATFLYLALSLKRKEIAQLQATIIQLKGSLDKMDEQAKLVMRTDLELNKTQEELDKRISGLYTLQRLSRTISTTLEESHIFKMLGVEHLETLGFQKACAFLWSNKEKKFRLCLAIGYPEKEISNIESFLESNKYAYSDLVKSSIHKPENTSIKDKIKQVFGVRDFVISGIEPKEGDSGFLFVGKDAQVTAGDEELIIILANQLGQALENARLFEKTWLAQQSLERKVEERTRELTLALEEIKKVSKRKTDFVSSVSHELRTPLTSIKGYASILLTGKLGALPEDVRQRLEKINRHSDELAQFVNDLLDIARIESGRMAMKKELQDLEKIAEEAADLLSVQLKEKQVTLSFHIGENIPLVSADHNQIKRVFINLINNAIKFVPQKTGKIDILIHKLNQEVQTDIRDNGCGMSGEEQSGLFQEFYRVDNPINQQVKGSGLGLALVKNIIEAHQGRVWVKSKKNEGTTFSFALPGKG